MKVIFVFIFVCRILVARSMVFYGKCDGDECVLMKNCPILMKVWNKSIISPDDVVFLNSRICSESNGQTFFCCKEKLEETVRIIETTTSVPTTQNYVNLETTTSVPTPLHCGDSGFSSMLSGTNTSIDEFPWTALLQYTYRKFHDLFENF